MADRFCDICGDVGYAELMVTCTKCKVVREHLYCMPDKSDEVPKSWICGNCTFDEAKGSNDSGLEAQPKMLKHGKTCKVKFLPTDEVIKLSSGGMLGPSKLNSTLGLQKSPKFRKAFESSMPRPLFQAPKESQERSSLIPPKIGGVKKKALATCLTSMPAAPGQNFKKVNATDTPACTSSASRHGLPPVTNTGKVLSPATKLEDTQKHKKDALLTHEVHAYCDGRGKEVPSPSTKLEDTQKQKKDASLTHEVHLCRDNSRKEVPSPSTRLENTQKRKDALFTRERHARHDNKGKEVPSPSTKLEDSQKQMKDALMIQEIHKYRDYLPSLHASWKGGLQFIDGRMAGEFYDGFLAKPPCVVRGRVYELSRKIPPILQVKLLSRSDIWDDLFYDECPDLADIALYFFPGNIEMSRTNNSYLFELMDKEDLLIRSLVDGAELVLFTCRQLDRSSQYVINMFNADYLLFGIFRDVGDDQSPFPMLEYGPEVSSVECDSRTPLLEFTPNIQVKHDEDNAVQREIDNKVGNTKPPTANDLDSTIQRLILEFGSQKPKESDANGLNLNAQVRDQEPAPTAARGSYSLSLSKVKTEPSIVLQTKESDANGLNVNAQVKDQEPAPTAATGSYSRSLSKVKTEPSGVRAEGSDGKTCLQTVHCSRLTPTFSIDGSQNVSGLNNQDVPKRVAEKYLQIFNAGIKKERR